MAASRLDDYLCGLTDLSKNKIRSMLTDRHVSVNGKTTTDRARELVDGDIVMVFSAVAGRSINFTYPDMDGGDWPRSKDAKSRSNSRSRSDDEDEAPAEGKARLRPSHEILHQIKWDAALSSKVWQIGYEDRFTGIQEVSMETWDLGLEEGLGSIPAHRIRYFKADGVLVWDRATRMDRTRELQQAE
eukprot:c46184_g1_i1.p1 GENE.c46184_g1_i1~~c46184_g1_i1.p1  ORF type:complete len:219 (+),score=23.98 c46184_g1_i1:98-658(+)